MERTETEPTPPADHPRNSPLAIDIMTNDPRTIREDESVTDALELLEQLDVRHLPVVDDEGNLVGMLSDRDLRPLRSERDDEDAIRRARTPVADVMTSAVVSVTSDAELEEVVELMLEHRIGAIPVVDGEGQVVGIVSYVDVLRAYVGAP